MYPEKVTVNKRISEDLAELRKQGLRPVEIWVPDVRAEDFGPEAHRQSLLVANSSTATEDMNFVEGVAANWPK
jgi:hypothetical protein